MRKYLAYILVIPFAALAAWAAAYWRHMKTDDTPYNANEGHSQHAATSGLSKACSIVFFSVGGDVIASGSLTTSTPRSSADTLTGIYSLEMHPSISKEPDVLWFRQLFEGKLVGKFEQTSGNNGAHSSFNFMPGIADANVHAEVDQSANGLSDGRWTYETFAGGYQGGLVVVKDGKTSPNPALVPTATPITFAK